MQIDGSNIYFQSCLAVPPFMVSYSWRLSCGVAVASLGIAVAANTVNVVVDAAANLEQGSGRHEIDMSCGGGQAVERTSLATVSEVQREALECPASGTPIRR
eukprot:Skav225426  [mRNA]  locus=scaffold680:287710:290228:- [translate_table: standard]